MQNLAAGNQANMTHFLDSTVTKFLDQVQDDISVTKFLAENDVTVTKFLSQAEDDIAVTKYLAENDITVTKFLQAISEDLAAAKFLAQSNGDSVVSKYLQQAMDDIAVTKYMESVITKFLEEQEEDKLDLGLDFKYKDAKKKIKGDFDLSMGRRQQNLEQASNDITVTKFLSAPNDTSVTKFLD